MCLEKREEEEEARVDIDTTMEPATISTPLTPTPVGAWASIELPLSGSSCCGGHDSRGGELEEGGMARAACSGLKSVWDGGRCVWGCSS